MANTIDERVVSMKFDNKQFKSAASETMSVLKDLETKANLKNFGSGIKSAAGDFNELGSSARNVDLSSVGREVEGATKGFSALKAIGVGALLSIGDKAVEVGGKIADAMVFRGAREGFQEYELQMNSIQTIMANTARHGTTMADVESTLGTLNEYADKTIYNFAEMTRNIGTFTAAGVELDTSAKSIKGIANLAAMSGSNSQQASTAMYQLSQAISAGSVKLQDWNSVVNAGMGGQAFQEALWDSAKAMGTLTEKSGAGYNSFTEWVDAGNSFRESLSDEWITTDVLTSTLENFTGELSKADLVAKGFSEDVAERIFQQGKMAEAAATEVKTATQLFDTIGEAIGSGWAETWKIIVGDFEEAKQLFTGINSVVEPFINKMSDSRNALLSQWKDAGGRDALIEGFAAQFRFLGQIIKPITDSFGRFFNLFDAAPLIHFTNLWKNWSKSLVLSGENAQRIGRIFDGVFGALKVGQTIIVEVVKAVGRLFGAIAGGSGGILEVAASVGDLISSLTQFILKSNIIQGIFQTLTSVLIPIIKIIGLLVAGIGKVISILTAPILKALPAIGKAIGEAFEKAGNAIGKFAEFITRAGDSIKRGFSSGVGKTVRSVLNNITDGLSSVGSGVKKFFDNNVVAGFAAAFDKVGSVAGKVKRSIGDFFGGMSGFKAPDISSLGDGIVKMSSAFKDGAKNAGKFMSTLDARKLGETLRLSERMSNAFNAIKNAVRNFNMPDFSKMFSGFNLSDISGIMGNLKSMGANAASSLSNSFSNVKMGSAGNMFDSMKESVANFVNYVRGINWSGIFSGLWDGLKGGASSAWDGMKNIGSRITESLRNIDWAEAGRTAAELIIKGIVGTAAAAVEIGKWLTEAISSAIQSIDWAGMWAGVKEFGSVFKNFGTEMKDAFEGNATEVPTMIEIFGESNGDKLAKTVEKVGAAFRDSGGKIKDFANNVKAGDSMTGLREMLGDSWVDANEGFSTFITTMTNGIATISKFLVNPFKDLRTKFESQAKPEFKALGTSMKKQFENTLLEASNIDPSRILNSLGVAMFGASALQFANLGKTLVSPMSALSTEITKIGTSAAGVLDSVRDSIKNFSKVAMMEAQSNAILKVAISIGIMAGALYFLAQLEPESLWRGVIALAAMMAALMAMIVVLSKVATKMADTEGATKSIMALGLALIGIAVAIAVMTRAVEKLSAMDTDSLVRGIGGLAAMMAILVVAVKMMPEKDLLKASVAILSMAGSLKMMATAVEAFSKIDGGAMAKGLIGLAVSMGILVGATRLIKPSTIMEVTMSITMMAAGLWIMAQAIKKFEEVDYGSMLKAGLTLAATMGVMAGVTKIIDPTRIMAISASLGILAFSMMAMLIAIKQFADTDTGVLVKGILGVASAVLLIGGAMNAFPKTMMEKVGVQLVAIAGAMIILSIAVERFGAMDVGTLAKGILSIGAAIAVIGVAMATMKSGAMVKEAAGLIIVSAALAVLASVVERFGSMDTGTLIAGLITMGAGLGIIAAAGMLMQGAVPGLLAGTAAMIGMSVAMVIMANAFQTMAGVPVGAIIGLIIGFAAALTILIAAAYLIMPVIPGLIALSVAFVAIGAAAALVGAGVMMIGVAMNQLAQAIQIFVALGPQAMEGARLMGQAAVVMIVAVAAGLTAAAPIIVASILAILAALIVGIDDFLTTAGPSIVNIVVKLLELVAKAIVEAVDILSDALLELILRLIENLEEWGPQIVDKFADFVIGMADALREKIPEVAQAMVDLYQTLWDTIAEKGPELVRITVEGFKQLVSGVADELRNAGPKWLSEGISAANQLIRGIVSAIRNGTSKAINAVKDMAKKVIDKAKGVFQIKSPSRVFMKIGDHVVQGMANGITNNGSAIASSGAMAQGVIDEATNTLEINSPSKVFDSIGQNVGKGFNQGIKKSMGKSKNTMADHLDEMISTVIGRSYKMSDAARAFFNGFSNVLDGTFSEANLSKQMKHAEAQRAMLVKERKIKKMEEDRAKKEKKEKIYEDVKEAKKALREAEEDKVNAKKDADQAAAENAKAEKEAKGKKKKAKKEKKQKASDATKARRDAENREKKIKDARKNLEKAEWEREKYEYEMNGEECGIAFVDGVAKGFIKEEERIPSVIELFVDAVYGQLEKIKKKMDEQVQAWGAIRSVRGTFKEITKGLTDFRRALTRAANTTSDKSFIRNLGVAGDAIFGIVEALMGVWTVLDKLKPVLPSVLSQFEHFAPQLAAAVAPIAPTLAKQLGGGLAAALPAIIGPAIQIVGSVLAVFGVLWDLGGDQRIVKWLDRIVLAVSTFLKTLPQRIGGFIQKLIKGLKWLVTDGIDFLVNMIMAIFDGVVAFIVATPQIVVDVIMALVDLAITLLTQSPVRLIKAVIDLVARVFVGLIQALPDLVVGLFKAFRDLGVGLVRAIVDSFWGIVDALKFVFFELPKRLFESIVAAVRGIVDAFFSTFRRIFRIGRPQSRRAGEEIIEDFSDGMNKRHETLGDRLLRPFRSLRDGVRKLFGIRSPSRVMSEMGGYVVEGFANGVAKNTHLVDNSMGGFQDALSKSVDQIIAEAEALANNDMVFTPELDMSLAESELSRFNDSVSTSFAYSNADLISSFGSNSEAVGGVVNNVTFNQTNTSPKPLSALEIYRNTDRLLEGAIR